MSVPSYFKFTIGGRFVNVWPAATGETGYFDVQYGDVGGDVNDESWVQRVTAYEAAVYVVTELGAPHKTTVASLEGMIRRWRDDFEAQDREPIR